MIISLQSPSSLLLLPREFKKLRRQLQRKRDIKIELCVKSSLLQLFYVDHVVQNRRSDFRLLCTNGFHVKANNEDLLLRARVVVRTSNTKISRRRFPDYVKPLLQKACRTCSTIIFLHSTNQIIYLWRCR